MNIDLNPGCPRTWLSGLRHELGVPGRLAEALKPITTLLPNCSRLWLLVLALLPSSGVFASGNWLKCGFSAPDSVGFMLLLSDGTVIALNYPSSTTDDVGTDWYRLTPDPNGHYVNGEWSRAASMTYRRHAFGSQVLPDGRVLVIGGEHPVGGAGEASAEIYNPVRNFWSLVNPPRSLMDGTQNSPNFGGNVPNKAQGFIDCNSVLLPNGTVLIAPVAPAARNQTLIYNPKVNFWTNGPATIALQAEASWVKLPDQSELTVDADTNNAERYIPSLNQWIPDAPVPVNLWASLQPNFKGEIGPAFLLPNGKAIFLGGSGHTAIYTPSGLTNWGSWVPGPDMPNGLVSADAPAAMLPNGKILCALSGPPYLGPTSPVDSTIVAHFTTPTSFYEYDYSAGPTGTFTQVDGPSGTTDDVATEDTSMLMLPDGSVLYCHIKQNDLFYSSFGSQLYVYVPSDGIPVPAGKPYISSITPNSDGSFHLTGTGLTGISSGAAFGDEGQMDSNYPIIMFKDPLTGHLDYARTFNWSSTGVMLGYATETADFTLPPGLIPQNYDVSVSVNGIISDPLKFSYVTPAFIALCPGESTTLKLITPPDPTLNYQWSFNPSGFEDPKPLLGETNAELNIVSAQTNQTGYYALGWDFKNDIIISPYVPVAVGVWVVEQPPTTNSAAICQPYSMSVHARGKGTLTAQWFRNGNKMAADSRISLTSQPGNPGETIFSINISQTKYQDDATYTVLINDDCTQGTTLPFALRVVPNPPWVRIATEGPPSRHDAAMCYDSDRKVTVLFGGGTLASGAAGFLGDTWEFDGTNWTQRFPPNSPVGRTQANMVYDTKRHRTVLFGGQRYDGTYFTRFSPETWEWDGANWQKIVTANLPPWTETLYTYASCYDSVRGEMLLFGYLHDPLWSYDGTDWKAKNVGGLSPSVSNARTMAFDANRGMAVLLGARSSVFGMGNAFNESVWEWDGTAWLERPQSGQQPTLTGSGDALCYDTFRQECILFGDEGGSVDGYQTTDLYPAPDYVRCIWRWNGKQWQADPPTPTVGVPFEFFHSMCFDSARNALVLFGGESMGQFDVTNYTYEIVYQDSPAVLKQPTVQFTVLGYQGQISVVAAGAPPISYQWQKDGVTLTDSDHLLDSTNDTLQIVSVNPADLGLYRVVLSNLCGMATSQPIQLRVTAPPVSIAVFGNHLNMVWSDPAATLQTATSPAGPWTAVPAAVSPYTVVPNTSRGFFRLVH